MDDAKAVDVVHAFGYLLCSPQKSSLQQHKGCSTLDTQAEFCIACVCLYILSLV